jgi:cyanophycin synthetase
MTSYHFVPLLGPNRWSSSPILELHIASQVDASQAPAAKRVAALLQAFLDGQQYTTSHPQSVANASRVVKHLELADRECDVWLLIARWFSAMAGVPTADLERFREQRSPSRSGVSASVTIMAMEMEEKALSEKCYRTARELLDTAHLLDVFPLAQRTRELFDFADDVRLGPSSRAILRAARRRNIPYTRMNRGSLVQLGEGCRQRRIWTAETDATSAIAEAIASDKDLTKRLLRQVGVPVPHGRPVANAEDAWVAAQEIGFPVVVKPCDANHQRGISIELSTRDEIMKAYDFAVVEGETNEILVEKFAEGHHHRLLVVGNRLVAAAKGQNDFVVGDGTSSIEALVHEANRDPRRGEAYTDPLGVIALTPGAIIEINKQGYELDSVPPKGKVVVIRRTGDLTTDCTEEVHPQTAEQAVLAARVVGLDIAGLDVLAKDIRVPLDEQRGAVVEVNAGPSLSPHVSPLYGKPQKVGDAIMDLLFPNGQQGHIKIIGIVKSRNSDALVEQFEQQLRLQDVDFGTLSHGKVGFNGRVVDTGSSNDQERIIALLCNPILSALVVHLDLPQAAEWGLCAPRLDWLIMDNDTVPASPNEEWWAGLRAVLHAVPAGGSIFGDRLPHDIFHAITTIKHPESVAKNSLDRAFEIDL